MIKGIELSFQAELGNLFNVSKLADSICKTEVTIKKGGDNINLIGLVGQLNDTVFQKHLEQCPSQSNSRVRTPQRGIVIIAIIIIIVIITIIIITKR